MPPGQGYGQAQAGYQQAYGNDGRVGIFPVFMNHNGSTIVLKEHVLSLTGDSFSIKTADGQPILQVEGKLMSLHGRKKVSDMAGNHLFDIVKEHMHIHTTFACEDPQGQKLMEVKSSFKRKRYLKYKKTETNDCADDLQTVLGSSATATFPVNAPEGQQHTLKMKGSIFDTSAEIVDEKTGKFRILLNGMIGLTMAQGHWQHASTASY